jgi:DNA gyrase subunit A
MTQEELFAGRIEDVQLEDEIQRSYLDYSMSVIVGRALPEVRDGLKPVHRRILWSMLEGGLRPDRPYRKSAWAVGEVVKKYHPHGLEAVYDSLVRMAQDFSLRHPLVDPHGNFGSVDGDPPAAMRYCVAGETLVRFADGRSAPIAQIVPDAPADTDHDIDLKLSDRRGDPTRATKLFHSGTHPTLQIETRQGYRLTGTHNHPVLCLESIVGVPMLQWKFLEEIRPGDRVALLRQPADGFQPLPDVEEDLAVLAGAWVSEGWASSTRAGFNNVDEEYFDRVVAAYDAVVGGRYYVSRRKIASGSVLHELDVHNLDNLRRSPLGELVGSRSAAKRVPSFVWRGTPSLKRAFLQALFEGDGSSSLLPRCTIQISYSTRSEELARGVQQLLLEFGLISSLCASGNGEWKVVVTNRREARLFATRVGFLGRKQHRLLAQLDGVPRVSTAMSTDHVPFVAAYLRSDGAERYVDRDWLARHNIDRIERWDRDRDDIWAHVTNEEARRVVEPLVEGRYYFAEVASVEPGGPRAVYSVRVDSDEHAFVTNGFVSHNTEARLAPIALELLRDIDAETVDFIPNYDGYEMQPVVLPSRFPNLLVNGSGGIAVGMATNIPPHNLGEVIDGVVHFIDHPESKPRDLMKFIKGPDFPTGGIVMGRDGIKDAYETGRGSIKVRAVCTIEESSSNRQRIVVSELPYQVNKARLAEKIAELHRAGRVKDIADIKDHSSGRAGMRLVIELKRGANPQVVLNQLYKHTQLQDNFGVIMLALVDGVPRTLNLAEVTGYYVDHQVDVVTRRTRYQLRRAEERDHIVQGLLIALGNLDAVIRTIRGSQDAEEARGKLMKQFKLSEIQANHILDMPLRRLTKLAREELEQEHKDLLARIRYLKALLKDPKKIRGVVKEELLEIKKRYGNPRRTQLKADEGELDVEDLIAEEDVVITVSRAGYVKRQPIENFRRQGRGGKGIRGQNLKEEDVVRDVFTTTTHHWLLFFTSKGKVYRVKVHEVPESGRTARGTYAANLPGVGITADERVQAVIDLKEYSDGRLLLFATRQGMVKKTALPEYDSPRTGLAAINLKPGDELIDVRLTDGKDDVFLMSRKGQTIRFREGLVRPTGRQTAGVIGMRLAADDEVIALGVASEGEEMISVTQQGYGKRTPLRDYPAKGRGGKGVIGHTLTRKTGQLAGAFVGSKDQDMFVISSSGIVIRVAAGDIRRVGRASQGVRTMRVEEGATVVALAPVIAQVEGE